MNIEWLKNKLNEKFYPVTHSKAVLYGDDSKTTVEQEIDSIKDNVVQKRENGYSYNNLASFYSHNNTPKYVRICIPKTAASSAMCTLEISLKSNYSKGYFGKIFFSGNWSSDSEWNARYASVYGLLPNTIKLYCSDKQYIYIAGCNSYVNCTLDKMTIGNDAVNYDMSAVVIDSVTTLPSTYQTVSMRYDINSSNISEQTVSYATTAGSASASDVYDWAKSENKPTYTASEVGAMPITGGIATGTELKVSNNGKTAGVELSNDETKTAVFNCSKDGNYNEIALLASGSISHKYTTNGVTQESIILTSAAAYTTDHVDYLPVDNEDFKNGLLVVNNMKYWNGAITQDGSSELKYSKNGEIIGTNNIGSYFIPTTTNITSTKISGDITKSIMGKIAIINFNGVTFSDTSGVLFNIGATTLSTYSTSLNGIGVNSLPIVYTGTDGSVYIDGSKVQSNIFYWGTLICVLE